MAKRTYGSGSIFKLPDGRLVGVVTLGSDEYGKPIRKRFYGPKKKPEAIQRAELNRKIKQAHADHAKGLPVNFKSQTFAQFLEFWLENHIRVNKAPRSYESFGTIIRNHINPALGRVRLDKLTTPQVQVFLNQMTDQKGLSPASIRHIKTVLVAALNKAVLWKNIQTNVAQATETPKIRPTQVRFLTAAEAFKLLDACENNRFGAIFALELNLGLRRSEALGIPWDAVDFENRRIEIRQGVQRIGGKLTICDVKNDSIGTVGMTDSIYKLLKAQQIKQLEMRLKAGPAWQDKGLVFTNFKGGPLEPVTFSREFKRVLQKAELPDIRLHDLRHSAGTLLVAQGVPMKHVQQFLRHKSMSTTAKFYAHVDDTMLQAVGDTMEKILAGK